MLIAKRSLGCRCRQASALLVDQNIVGGDLEQGIDVCFFSFSVEFAAELGQDMAYKASRGMIDEVGSNPWPGAKTSPCCSSSRSAQRGYWKEANCIVMIS